MKVIRLIVVFILNNLLLACNDVFDVEHIGAITDEQLWNNSDYIEYYVNDQYNIIESWNQNSSFTEEATENVLPAFLEGKNLTSKSSYPGDFWDYSWIRKQNYFFDKIDNTSVDISEDKKNALKGEMYFFRALTYFRMVRTKGGVPIIKDVMNPYLPVENLFVERNSTLECFDYIISNLDSAIVLLPSKMAAEKDRINKVVAMAFKAQVLLLKASPLFCLTKNVDFWEEAYHAAKVAKEEADKSGYTLYDDGTKKATENWWYDKEGAQVEMIFRVAYKDPEKRNSHQAAQRPLSVSSGAAGLNNPSWQLVEAFPMENGMKISDPASGYNESLFWVDRDPRFYNTIVYNGATYGFAEDKNRIQWIFRGGDFDSYKSEYNKSGFFSRKGVDTTLSVYTFSTQAFDWPVIRYAELLLDLAECANEVGRSEEAVGLICQIRKRAKILPGKDGRYGLSTLVGIDYDETLDAIMTEREVEFAYEGKRFWDLRRRRMFFVLNEDQYKYSYGPDLNKDEILKLSLPGINVNSSILEINQALSKYILDNEYLIEKDELLKRVSIYSKGICDESGKIIDVPDSYYFAPISPDEIQKNPMLKQNVGWDNGDFNPIIQ